MGGSPQQPTSHPEWQGRPFYGYDSAAVREHYIGRSALMDDGDECFDLDKLVYASDFGAPTDRHGTEGFRWTGPGLGALPFAVGFAGSRIR